MRVRARKRSETLGTDWKKMNIGTGSVQTLSFLKRGFLASPAGKDHSNPVPFILNPSKV
jgi:hypothetical protein